MNPDTTPTPRWEIKISADGITPYLWDNRKSDNYDLGSLCRILNEYEARLAPLPEEAVIKESLTTEPAHEWRDVGEDEVIQMDDMYLSDVSSRNYPVTSVMIGNPVENFPEYSFRTRRPMPKQEGEQPYCSRCKYNHAFPCEGGIEGMPLETPLDLDIEEIEAVANHPLAPRVDFYTRQLAMRSAHAIRYLRDEIEQLKKNQE